MPRHFARPRNRHSAGWAVDLPNGFALPTAFPAGAGRLAIVETPV